MSIEFREYLRKVGSGPHTSKSLNRAEAAQAYRLMLTTATPAQIGGFMIAHRIKRPTGEELAGMLDAYNDLGPSLAPIDAPYLPMVMCNPYDGRSRTSPLSPLIALLLSAAGVPVITPGGDRMPTKMGVPLVELWQSLGVNWSKLSLSQTQQVFAQNLMALTYLPNHFPLAHKLVEYRVQIGKRPPLATLELLWSPYAGDAHIVSGFVHPPTENMFRVAAQLHGLTTFTAVKGLEGSCDLPRDRTVITMLANQLGEWRRYTLHPRDFGAAAKELPLLHLPELISAYRRTLAGESSDLTNALVWSAGFYLWRADVVEQIEAGLALAQELLRSGKVLAQLERLQQSVGALADSSS